LQNAPGMYIFWASKHKTRTKYFFYFKLLKFATFALKQIKELEMAAIIYTSLLVELQTFLLLRMKNKQIKDNIYW
jgi:hypothetical protein